MAWLAVAAAAVIGLVVGVSVGRRTARHTTAPVVGTGASERPVRREIERARRYERQFALIRLAAPGGGAPDTDDDLLELVRPVLRGLDHAWVEPRGVHVLLPEVGRDEGEACIERLRSAIGADALPDARLAVFPDDAVTEGALDLRLAGTEHQLPAAEDLPRSRRPQVIDLVEATGHLAS